MKFGCLIGIFLSSAHLICQSTDISKYFRGVLRLRDNESRRYLCLLSWMTEPLKKGLLKKLLLEEPFFILKEFTSTEPIKGRISRLRLDPKTIVNFVPSTVNVAWTVVEISLAKCWF